MNRIDDHDLAAARRLAAEVRPFAWSDDHMREEHYEMAAEAMALLPDLVAEIDAHRARIAAHAAAHPERLSEEVLDGIATALKQEGRGLESIFLPGEVGAIVAEALHHRARIANAVAQAAIPEHDLQAAHRARIAAHAAAHPERTSDDRLSERIAWLEGRDEGGRIPIAMGGLTEVERRELKDLREIQQRRAWDLTPEEVEALRWAVDRATPRGPGGHGMQDHVRYQDAKDALRKLLRAHGSTP